MANGQQTTTPDATTAATTQDFKPLSVADFAAKVRERAPQLTPEVVDDATLVRKVLERRPDLVQYVQGSEPRPKLRRGREHEADASGQIKAIFKQRGITDPKPDDLEKLPWGDRFHVLSIVAKNFAENQAQEFKDAKGWRDKLHALIGTVGGVSTDVISRMATGVTEPKNLAIGATGLVDPIIPSAYFFFEGTNRLPGEVRKLAHDPSYENIVTTGLTGAQVAGSAAAGYEGVGTGIGTRAAIKGAKQIAGMSESIKSARGNPEIVERIVADARKARDKYDAQIAAINREYADDFIKREEKITEAEAEYAEKLANVRAEWIENTAEAHHARKGAAMVEAHRQKLESSTQALGKIADDNVKNVEKLVHSDLDRQFNDVREKVMEQPATDEHPAIYPQLNADYLKGRVEQARQMLHGAPEDLKVFNDLVRQMVKEEKPENEGSIFNRGQEVTLNWDEGRTQSSALGRASASESVSGNVRRAIRYVLGDVEEKVVKGQVEKTYTGLEGELQRVADERGAGKAYAAARNGWRQYQEDFHDMSAEKGGGSPLARVVRAADPAVILDELNGKSGDRLIETFAKYSKFGAVPKNLAHLRDLDMELSSLPKSDYVPEPAGMEKLTPPQEPAPVKTPTERITEQKVAGHLKEPPTPDQMLAELKEAKRIYARDATRRALKPTMHDVTMAILAGEKVFGQYNSLYASGYVILRLGSALAKSLPAVQRWLARVTENDVRAINEAYKDDAAGKTELQEGVTDALIEGAKKGNKPNLGVFNKFLTPAQLGRIVRAYAPYGTATNKKELGITPPPVSPMQVQVQ